MSGSVAESIDWAIVAVRFATYGLAILLFGAALFRTLQPAPGPARSRVAAAAPLALGLAALTYLALLARQANGGAGWPPADLTITLAVGTGFGRALVATAACGLALAVVRQSRPRLVLSGVALAGLAFVGHAADGEGPRGLLRLAVMALHLLAVGAWLGALGPLAAALIRDRDAAPAMLRRFGNLALLAVFVVLGAGLCSLAFVIADARGAIGGAYLRALVVKLLLVAALLAVAAVNRWLLTPLAARDADRAIRWVRASIAAEQALGAAVIAAVAVLGQLDPAMRL
ncbi:MAG TPA: CopD family protein [Caulobacteraceae bacterium]